MRDQPTPEPRPAPGDALVRTICERLQTAADAAAGANALLDTLHGDLGITGGMVVLREGAGARVLAFVGLPSEWVSGWTEPSSAAPSSPFEASLVRESLAASNPVIDLRLKRLGVRGILTLPLAVEDRTAGAIVMTSTRREPFGDADRACLEAVAASFAEWVAPWVPRERDLSEVLEAEIVEALRPIQDTAPDALATSIGAMSVATIDAEGRFHDVGKSFARLVGVDAEALPGRSLCEALDARDESRTRTAIETARNRTVAVLPSVCPRVVDERPGQPIALDLILSRRDDSSIVVFGLPVVDVVAAATVEGSDDVDDGGLRRPASGVMILDRRKIEMSGQWRRWSGELLAVLGGSTLVLDPGGRIVELGAEWLRDDEASSVAWLGRHFGELFDTERVEVLEALQAVAREGMWSGHLRAQGVPVPVYLRAVRNDRGDLEAIVGARLPERSPEVRDLFQKVPVGLILVDCELRVLEANPELGVVLRGCALPDELRGLDVRSLAPFQTREAQEALDALPERRSLDLPDVHLVRQEPAAPLVAQLRAQELHDAHGKPVGFVLTLLGRGGKTQIENRLIEAQKMDSIGNFAAGLAHDFGNLVAVILSKARAVHERIEANPAAERQVVDIEVAAKRAQHLAEELIRFARGGRTRASTLHVNQLVKEVVALIEASVGSNIDVKFELAEGLPSIEGDEVELQQMILNLCLNARDAMEEGGTLTIETRPLAGGELDLLGTGDPVKSGVCLQIRDTGVGMPDDVLEHVFEPFFTTKDDHSSGLGLAMVYAIARRHGGTIDVKSERGRGTTFEVLLPGDGVPVSESAGKRRVLVADDEPAFREMVRLILEDEGHEVWLARDGAEALKVLHTQHAELGLVVLDLRMPGVDGLAVLEELQAVAPSLPVLITSGWAEPEDKEAALRLGAKRILEKPYRAAALRQAVRELLRPQEAEGVAVESGGGWARGDGGNGRD